MKLSVVTTLYRSEGTLNAFHRRVADAAVHIPCELEFVYVNDGSPDASLGGALALCEDDPRVTVIDLARNFGHHAALMIGLEAASGDFVFLIDSDLEEPPELLPTFWAALADQPSADAVFGVQVARKGGFAERWLGRLWYALFCRLTDAPYHPDSLTARLMSRRFVDSVLLHKERDLDMMGIFALTGYEQIACPAVKESKGSTSYTLSRRLCIAATGLTSVTTAPLSMILMAGSALSLVALLAAALWLILVLTGAVQFTLPLAAILSVWLIGGLLMVSIGIVALYLGRVLQEAKARPLAIIRRVYGKGGS